MLESGYWYHVTLVKKFYDLLRLLRIMIWLNQFSCLSSLAVKIICICLDFVGSKLISGESMGLGYVAVKMTSYKII